MPGPAPWLYLDADGFFASCEEAADPRLHGRAAVSSPASAYPDAPLIAVNTAAKRARARALLWGVCGDPRGPYTGAKIAYQSFPDLARLRWLGLVGAGTSAYARNPPPNGIRFGVAVAGFFFRFHKPS